MNQRGRRCTGRATVAAALAVLAVVALSGATARAAGAKPPPETAALQARLLATARATLATADRQGAQKVLPRGWAEATAALAAAEARIAADPAGAGTGSCAAVVDAAETAAARLLAANRFVQDLRRQKEPWQAIADAWDRDLNAAARAAGVAVPATAVGTELAQALVDSLGRQRLRWQGQADSLNAARRVERRALDLEIAERDSSLAVLRARVRELQQGLWDLEMRAGVTESERAGVEARLRAERERADLLRGVAEAFTAAGGTAAIDTTGNLVLRHAGLAFAPGKTAVTADMDSALAAIARAVAAFPEGRVRVEGHTDDSGRRADNLKLSQARAEAIVAALRARGEPSAAIDWQAVGVGPDRPLVPNRTAADREMNRRIEIVIPRGGASP